MNIKDLMSEYSIEINDVRWFLANNLAYSITQLSKNRLDLINYIESGKLEVDLYNLEENYLIELQDLIDRNKIDIVDIRENFNKILLLKNERNKL